MTWFYKNILHVLTIFQFQGDILDLATDGIGLDQENLHTDNTMESNENLDPLAKMFFDYKAT